MVGKKGTAFFIILILSCTIIGSFLGDVLKQYLPDILSKSFSIGAGPLPVNLKVISMTLGISINMNSMSIIGLITALVIYKRY
jgi:hypothetical protein